MISEEKLYEVLTVDELSRLKAIGLTRNVRIKDLTLQEVEELTRVMWPYGQACTFMDVIKQLIARRVIK